LPQLVALDALVGLVKAVPDLFVCWSPGDSAMGRDGVAGLEALDPPWWWTGPLDVWVARMVTSCARQRSGSQDRCIWVLVAHVVEPASGQAATVVAVDPVASLTPWVLRQATVRASLTDEPVDDDQHWPI
jgi:hypothetical protein